MNILLLLLGLLPVVHPDIHVFMICVSVYVCIDIYIYICIYIYLYISHIADITRRHRVSHLRCTFLLGSYKYHQLAILNWKVWNVYNQLSVNVIGCCSWLHTIFMHIRICYTFSLDFLIFYLNIHFFSGSIIVHVMTPQMRNFYKLEKRWKEAEVNICIWIFMSIFVIIIIKSGFFHCYTYIEKYPRHHCYIFFSIYTDCRSFSHTERQCS
jgi:hypothetical protein